MPDKITSKELCDALLNKFSARSAVLFECTMVDEEAILRHNSANAIMNPNFRKYLDKKGEPYDLNMVFPEGYSTRTDITSRRIDALIFETVQRTAVEVKISRADFFRDTDDKRSAWMRHTHRFVYLTPKGLVRKEEVPEGCGLWEYENGKIIVVKKATLNKNIVDFPFSMLKYFAYRAFLAEQKLRRKK